MRLLVCFLAALAVLAPAGAGAQMQPHRAEYVLRLGAAANAPRIGTAVQDLSQDCGGWHLKRTINTEIAITASWKMSLQSRLDAEEPRGGNGLRFHTQQSQNGSERETHGQVKRAGKELRAEIVPPSGPQHFALPPATLMPIASIDHVIERLRARAASFPAMTFDAEVIGDAFLVDVDQLDPGVLRGERPGEQPFLAGGDDLHPWPRPAAAPAVQSQGPAVRHRRPRPPDRRYRPGDRDRRPYRARDAQAPDLPALLNPGSG
jgi:hypothetical protein